MAQHLTRSDYEEC